MDSEPTIVDSQAGSMSVAAHVTLVPEGISSVRDIPGLNRATQGERAVLAQIQQTIDAYTGQPLEEFWTGIWKTLGQCLRMQTVYLIQVMKDLSSDDFLWLRTLYAVEVGAEHAPSAAPLRSGIYAAALPTRHSSGQVQETPTRLDLKRGACSKIPRSVEAQMQNEGLTCFYRQEIRTLAEKQSTITSSSGDGSNHLQCLPVEEELTGEGEFYLAFDRRGVSEPIGAFTEMIDFVHRRLNPALNGFIRLLVSPAGEQTLVMSAPAVRNTRPARRCAILYKPADSLEYPILARDIVLSANPSWPWQHRAVGLFTVEGGTGAALSQVADQIQELLAADFAQLTKADPVKVVKLFWTWHVKVYLLARQVRLPIRVSGSILSERAGEWEMYSLGTAPPVVHLLADDQNPIRFEMPNKNLHFLGYNPLSTAGTGESAGAEVIPTERMTPGSFTDAHRSLGIYKRNSMILFSSGWLEQCNPLHGPGYYETRYNSAGLLASLRRSYEEAGIEPSEALAQRLADDVSSFTSAVHDASLVVTQA